MSEPIRVVRLSLEAKERLIRLKRNTGIMNWNVLCRWALCRSLAESKRPSVVDRQGTSNVEMTWAVFAGGLGDVFLALLRQRCVEDGLQVDDRTVAEQFRLHLHRGIDYLAGERIRSVTDLVHPALTAPTVRSPEPVPDRLPTEDRSDGK